MESKNKNKLLAALIFTVITAMMLAITPVQAADDDKGTTGEAADVLDPSDVENVKAKAGNAEVTVSWDVATDNVGVTGYTIYYGNESVTGESGEYTDWLDAGDVVEFSVDGLDNGTEYFFAVTAYDAAGNESVNYSFEASAQPTDSAEEVDKEAPQVASTEAVYQNVVKVVFSEEVEIPQDSPELAFQITNTGSLEVLEVTEVMHAEDYKGELYKEDSTMTPEEKEEELEKTIVLVTDTQKAGDEYKLEVSIDIEDKSGNPVASGTSDTGVFDGTGDAEPKEEIVETETVVSNETETEKPEKEDDKQAPKLVSASSLNATEIEVKFNEAIELSKDPTNNFLIISETDADNELKVIGVVVADDGKSAKLTTSTQDATNYSVVALEIKDLAGNAIAVESSSKSFKGKAPEKLIDKIAPANITNFVSTVMNEVMVKLTWTASIDASKDLVDQVLYKSMDAGKSYDTGKSLGKDATSYDLKDLTPGVEYWLKLTTKDEAGNESDGVISKVLLPETGAGAAALIFASGILPSLWRKKKKSKK